MQLCQAPKFPFPIAAEYNLTDFRIGREGGRVSQVSEPRDMD